MITVVVSTSTLSDDGIVGAILLTRRCGYGSVELAAFTIWWLLELCFFCRGFHSFVVEAFYRSVIITAFHRFRGYASLGLSWKKVRKRRWLLWLYRSPVVTLRTNYHHSLV